MDLHPTVFVDASFTTDEARGIYAALNDWEASSYAVCFTRTTVEHESLLRIAAERNVPDAIYLIRGRGMDHATCPDGVIDVASAAVTWASHSGAVTCFDAEWIDANGSRWRSVAAHELGHALHLPHSKASRAVMRASYVEQADNIQCDDRLSLAREWSLPSPDCTE